MLLIISVVAWLAALVSTTGTPPGYMPSTNTTLGLKYGNVTVKPGAILEPRTVQRQPTLTLPTANTTQEYLLIFVDPTANLSAPIPASLLWFQPNITFASSTSPATLTANATSAYLAPSVPGHVYIALLYKQPPNFFIPPDFPYNNTFRRGFNVSRAAVDFKTGGPVAANFFELDPYGDQNASTTVSVTAMATATATGHVNVTSTISLFQFATATTQPQAFTGSAPRPSKGACVPWAWLVALLAYLTL